MKARGEQRVNSLVVCQPVYFGRLNWVEAGQLSET